MLADKFIERALSEWRVSSTAPAPLRTLTVEQGRELSRINPTLFYVPFEMQRKFHASSARGRVIFGGNRAGKTEAGVLEIVWGLYGGHPWKPGQKPADGWLCYLAHQKFDDTLWGKLQAWLPPGRWKWNATRRVLETDLGTRLAMKAWGDDPDGTKFESASIGFAVVSLNQCLQKQTKSPLNGFPNAFILTVHKSFSE